MKVKNVVAWTILCPVVDFLIGIGVALFIAIGYDLWTKDSAGVRAAIVFGGMVGGMLGVLPVIGIQSKE